MAVNGKMLFAAKQNTNQQNTDPLSGCFGLIDSLESFKYD